MLFGLFVIFSVTYTTSKRWRGELKKEEDFTTEQVEGSEDLHVAPQRKLGITIFYNPGGQIKLMANKM